MPNPIKAFTYQLGTNEISETGAIQHSPGWVIGVVPLANPDTFGAAIGELSNVAAVATRPRWVIENDCVSVRVAQSKATPFGTAELTLKGGDINYLGAVFPGDFIFIWMTSDRSKLKAVIDNFLSDQPANDFNSGLKFFGRVESVREHLRISNPLMGTKELVYTISAFSFQEFNTKVYIVPFLKIGRAHV